MHCKIAMIPVHLHAPGEHYIDQFLDDLLEELDAVVQEILDDHPMVELIELPEEEEDEFINRASGHTPQRLGLA